MRAVLGLVPLVALCLPGLLWWRARHGPGGPLRLVVGTCETEPDQEPRTVRRLHGHPSTLDGPQRQGRAPRLVHGGAAVVPHPVADSLACHPARGGGRVADRAREDCIVRHPAGGGSAMARRAREESIARHPARGGSGAVVHAAPDDAPVLTQGTVIDLEKHRARRLRSGSTGTAPG